MYKKLTALTAMALLAGSSAFSIIPLITNTDFEGYPEPSAFSGWIFGSNKFTLAGEWIEFVQAPDAYTYESALTPSGEGWVFTNYDDGVSDYIESYMFAEFNAGPAESNWPSIFETGDEIVFKVNSGVTYDAVDPSDLIVEIYVEFQGFNDIGWEFQRKPEYSDIRIMKPADGVKAWELRVTMPDLAVDDSLQVVKIGWGIKAKYDGTSGSFDFADVYFDSIEAYIANRDPVTPKWARWDIIQDVFVDTTPWMGFLEISQAPFCYSYDIGGYVYLPEGQVTDSGSYVYVMGSNLGGAPEPSWAGFPLVEDVFADTGTWLGFLEVSQAPWCFSYNLGKYIYLPEGWVTQSGAYIYNLDYL